MILCCFCLKQMTAYEMCISDWSPDVCSSDLVLIDHAQRLAEKIRISGGGRCNFTNVGTGPANFLSQNPNFCRSALAAYTPRDFIDLVEKHGIAWHEKHRGQLFCDESSEDILAMLKRE